jgi:D-serine deaminase-like pyridoxal phosphate-dependent protein
MSYGSINRRRFLVGGAATAGGVLAPAAARATAEAGEAHKPSRARRKPVELGSGGAPTDYPTIAGLAREYGVGEPIMFLDLAAIDQNAKVVLAFAQANGWAVRPALKVLRNPALCRYVMELLPEPRGLIFHMNEVDQVLAVAPRGTDLMMGYPPTPVELQRFLRRRPPRGQPPHRFRFLASSLNILQQLADEALTTPRKLPLEVGLEFMSGEGRGGFQKSQDISAALSILRSARDRLHLTCVLCYDGHATLNGPEAYRKAVAIQAIEFYRTYLDQLKAEGSDLYDAATLVRNGPGSANYRNWAGTTVCNEIGCGSAFTYAGYLSSGGYDNAGLAPSMTQCAPVLKNIGPYPAVPVTKTPLPGDTNEEYFVVGSSWPDQGGNQPAFVYPPGTNDDQLEGGRAAIYAPMGSLGPDDYVLCWPNQTGDGVDYFGSLTVVRNGRALDIWPNMVRWATPPA